MPNFLFDTTKILRSASRVAQSVQPWFFGLMLAEQLTSASAEIGNVAPPAAADDAMSFHDKMLLLFIGFCITVFTMGGLAYVYRTEIAPRRAAARVNNQVDASEPMVVIVEDLSSVRYQSLITKCQQLIEKYNPEKQDLEAINTNNPELATVLKDLNQCKAYMEFVFAKKMKCSISLEILNDPITLRNGVACERSSALAGIRAGKNKKWPFSGETIATLPATNVALKKLIDQTLRFYEGKINRIETELAKNQNPGSQPGLHLR